MANEDFEDDTKDAPGADHVGKGYAAIGLVHESRLRKSGQKTGVF